MNIFEKYITKTSFYKADRGILHPSYLPENLPHREIEIEHLASILALSLNGEKPSNILVFGKTGTGKTAVMRYMERELNNAQKILENMKKVRYVYINCDRVDTPYSILQNIGNQLIVDWDERIPFTGWPVDKLYFTVLEKIDEFEGVIIIILDEIDKLVSKSGDEIIYRILSMNEDLRYSKLSLLGISNDLMFTELLDPRVKSRLSEEKIVFSPYNAQQLENILRDRAEQALKDGYIEDSVIKLCSAFAAQEHGDARRAISLLRISIEIAEREQAETIKDNHVYKAKNKIELDCVTETIKTLPTQSKLILLSVIMHIEANHKKSTTGDIYTTYKILSQKIGVSPLSQRRISDLISELDMLGLVHAQIKSFGRHGRTRIIESSVPVSETKNIIYEDEMFESLTKNSMKNQMCIIQTSLL